MAAPCLYFDKSRDFAAGAALTDVAIGMGVPIVSTAIAMSAAESKEKKRLIVSLVCKLLE